MKTTKTLAKFLGLSVVLTVLGLVWNKDGAVATLNAFYSDAPLMWITGVFTMMLGVGILVAHNRWSGGPLPVVVTLYGWIALLKGLTFVCLPAPVQTQLYAAAHFEQYFYAYFVVAIVLGGYMIYGGFSPDSTTS